MTPETQCRSCKADILFAQTAAGRSIPMDPEPHVDGNTRLEASDHPVLATVLTAGELMKARTAGEKLYRSHFVTCPQGRQWQKRRAKEATQP